MENMTPNPAEESIPQPVEDWLREATKGLCASAQERIREDILSHIRDAVELEVSRGVALDAAVPTAVAGLGNPRHARKEFRKAHLTVYEDKRLQELETSVYPRRWVCLQGINLSAFVVACDVVTRWTQLDSGAFPTGEWLAWAWGIYFVLGVILSNVIYSYLWRKKSASRRYPILLFEVAMTPVFFLIGGLAFLSSQNIFIMLMAVFFFVLVPLEIRSDVFFLRKIRDRERASR